MRSASRASSSRRAANARRRSSCESGISSTRRRGAGHGLDAAEHRKELREGEDVARQDLLGFRRRKPLQVLAEGVDQAVERLVGHRLALVAAPWQHDRAGRAARSEEAAHERGLAGARRAVQANDRRRRPRGSLERRSAAAARCSPAADERGARRGGGAGATVGSRSRTARRRGAPGSPCPAGAPGRLSAQQVDAERVEVVRQPGHEVAGAPAASLCRLSHIISMKLPLNGSWPVSASKSMTPRLYQSVASRQRTARSPAPATCTPGFRRPRCVRLRSRDGKVGDQAEVEQDHAALARDEDVGRLDVAVELAGAVQSPDPRDHLPHGLAEPVRIERRRSHGVRILRRLERQGHQVAARRRSGPCPGSGRCGGLGRGLGPLHGIHGLRKRRPRTYSRKLTPSMSSIVKNHWSLVARSSCSRTRFGCEMSARARNSRLNRKSASHVAVAQSLEGHACVALPVERLIDDTETSGAEAPLNLKALGPAETPVPGRGSWPSALSRVNRGDFGDD